MSEKSPPNLICTRFLQALFPNSCFIILLRHPLSVSLATSKWSHIGIRSLVEHWLVCHERFTQDSKYLRKVFILKFEDFVARPQILLDDLCAFLGIEAVPVSQTVRHDANERYFSRWSGLIDGLQTRPQVECIQHTFEKCVNRFGYSLIDLDRVEPLRPD